MIHMSVKYYIYKNIFSNSIEMNLKDLDVDPILNVCNQLDRTHIALLSQTCKGLAPLGGSKIDALKLRDKSGGYQLHNAIQANFSEEKILNIFSKNSSAAYIKNNAGELPLHLIMKYKNVNGQQKIVMGLLEIYTDGLLQPTNDGRLPIHILLQNATNTDNYLKFVNYLISLKPESLVHKDVFGNAAQHFMFSNLLPVYQLSSSPDLLSASRLLILAQKIIYKEPKLCMSILNCQGHSVLHLLMILQYDNHIKRWMQDTHFKRFFLGRDRELFKLKDKFGNLPLQLAVNAGVNEILFVELVAIFADSFSTTNNKGNTILHTAMISPHFNRKLVMKICRLCKRYEVDLLQVTNIKGRTVEYYAHKHGRGKISQFFLTI